MLLLAYLYDLSERRTEAFLNDSLSAGYFPGLAIDESAPDHSKLTAFKRRIVRRGGEGLLDELLTEVEQASQDQGVAFGSIQLVDSTHTIANVDAARDDRRRNRERKRPRDDGARWGGKRKRRGGKKGHRDSDTEYFYGYKMHNSVNAEAKTIASIVVTAPTDLTSSSSRSWCARMEGMDCRWRSIRRSGATMMAKITTCWRHWY